MKLDKRNPFAAWGHEQEVYTKDENPQEGMVELLDEGFQNPNVDRDIYNDVSNPVMLEHTAIIDGTLVGGIITVDNKYAPEAFFTNNEVELTTVPQSVRPFATQLEREAGENLEYYGIQADDLKLYGKKHEEPEPEIDYSKLPLHFANTGDSPVTIYLGKNDEAADSLTMEISTDNENWSNWGTTSTTPLSAIIPVGEKLYVRSSTDNGYFNNKNPESNEINTFYTGNGGTVDVAGNIMSLAYKNFDGKVDISASRYCFASVFYTSGHEMDFPNTALINAKNLVLPATTLGEGCYMQMFNGCGAMMSAPELNAETLAKYCYMNMFNGCISLQSLKMMATDITAESCLDYFLESGSNGTLYCASGMSDTLSGYVPNSWTIQEQN